MILDEEKKKKKDTGKQPVEQQNMQGTVQISTVEGQNLNTGQTHWVVDTQQYFLQVLGKKTSSQTLHFAK